MLRLLILIALVTPIAGCVSPPPKPEPIVQWRNPNIAAKTKSGEMTKVQAHMTLEKDKHECLNEAVKVQIPSPSC